MASYNRIQILGNLGSDPELRYTQSGKAVARLSIATNEGRRGEEVVTWHKVVVWEKLAELCAKYLTKGSSALVEGRLVYTKWTDREGNQRTGCEIVAREVVFVGGGREERRGRDEDVPAEHDRRQPEPDAGELDDDEVIPF